jgi:uncharacterized membrane protein
MPYILPIEIHPVMVHFPIALLVTAVGLDILAATRKRWSIADAATWCMVFGTIGALAAGLSGTISERAINLANAGTILELHQTFAFATGFVFAVLLVLRLIWIAPRLLEVIRPRLPELANLGNGLVRRTLPALYSGRTPALLVVVYLIGDLVGFMLLLITGYLVLLP